MKKSILIMLLCLLPIVVGCGDNGTIDDSTSNNRPIAVAGADQVVNAEAEVILDGSASSDPDGELVSYQWTQVSGVPVSLTGSATVKASFFAPATVVRETLAFRLTVLDDNGMLGSDSVTITVNIPPTADAGPDQFALPFGDVELAGLAKDSDGFVVTRQWAQTAGTLVTLNSPDSDAPSFITPDSTETLTFIYTVTDNDGAQHSDSVSVFLSQVRFNDSFDNVSSLDNWIFVNDTSIQNNWGILNGALLQAIDLASRSLLESYQLGTFAHLKAAYFPTSVAFRFSVDITPQSSDVGIMFRYAADDKYFRLSMNDSYGYTRLEKRNGPKFETLAVNSRGYVAGQKMTVTVELNGDRFVVFINDEPLFAQANLDLLPGTVALYCQGRSSFDNVVIADNSLQPMVAISSPLAHSIALTSRDGDTPLLVEAVALNMPIGGSVVFILNDGPETPSTENGNLYQAWFYDIPVGEHEIAVVLKDAENREVARDTNTVVGVGGNYIVAVGDSITNGVGDKNPTNNSSEDRRIIAKQGFAAQLNNELTVTYGLPHIVFNEGIPGDRSIELETDRIDSILERHPKANMMLLLIGTNDAGSGTPTEDYKRNVEIIANTALTDVSRVYIARIPPRFTNNGDGSLHPANSQITLYNSLIDEICANPSDNIFPGPDFYDLFIREYYNFYDSDGIHPNDRGYQVMADAWNEILSATP